MMPGLRSLPSSIGADVRFALRQIVHTPLVSGIIIGVIALGIGTNAGLLTVLDLYAWHPAPGIERDAHLVRLTPMAARGDGRQLAGTRLSYPDVLDLRAERNVFADVAGYAGSYLGVDFGGGPEEITATYVTDNYFRMLGVRLVAGVGLPAGGDRSAPPVVVLDHSLWMSNFGGSPDAIGKTVRVMNRPFTIVGVAPPRFSGVDVAAMGQPMIWLPLGLRAELEPGATDDLTRRDKGLFRAVARLADGVGASDVSRRSSLLAARIAQQDPASHSRFTVRAERLTGMSSGASDTKELVAAFFIVVTLVVIITCTNVSSLLLGRAVARRKEVAVRLSLGAPRLRILRQMLTESLVLALGGALLGLALYAAVVPIAYATIPDVIDGLQPQVSTFVYAAIFALATTIVFGLAPALHATRTDIGEAMKNSGTLAIRRSRMQAGFVIVQLACSQPALVVAAMVLADIRAHANDNADKAPASVVTMRADLIRPAIALGAKEGDARRTTDVLTVIRRRIEGIPGVQSVALGTSGSNQSFQIPGREAITRIRQSYVTSGFFATHNIPVVRGRAVGVDDDTPGSVVAVVNQEAAALLWPNEDPIGRRLFRRESEDGAKGTTLEVIGVVGRAAYEAEESTPFLFVPMSNASIWRDDPRVPVPSGQIRFDESLIIAARTSPGSDARTFVPQVRAAIREVEPYVTVGNVTTLAERYAGKQREAAQANLAAFGIGTIALVLASIGLYAIIAFAVAQRTREIGVRMAIGATSGDVVRHFFRGGLIVTSIGLAIGLPLTVGGIRVVQASLIGFTFEQLAPVLLVVPVLIGVAALASWLPARRAGRVDPLVALRTE